MGDIILNEIVFSDAVRSDWGDSELFEKLKSGERFLNPIKV
jgi:6-pyruvoyltetrahydropterin/6-carboxytetrahydropterin synthase